MAKKLLVFGGTGLLGSALSREAVQAGWTVAALSQNDCSVSDVESVKRALVAHTPDAVVNAAGLIGLETCEKDPARAQQVNALGAGNVVTACGESGRIVPSAMMSTSYVFAGDRGPYAEDAEPVPQVEYGRSKYAGEKMAEEAARIFSLPLYILRSAWMYGEKRPTLIDDVIRSLQDGKTIEVAKDQYGVPASSRAAARVLLSLLEGAHTPGTYHLSENTTEPVSKYDFAVYGASLLSLDTSLIRAVESARVSGAFRPHNGMLAVKKSVGVFSWKEELNRYLEETYAR